MKITKKMIANLNPEKRLGEGMDKVVFELSNASVLKCEDRICRLLSVEKDNFELTELITLEGEFLVEQKYFEKYDHNQVYQEFKVFIEQRDELKNLLAKVKSSLYKLKVDGIATECLLFIAERADTSEIEKDALTFKFLHKKQKIVQKIRDTHLGNLGYRRGTKKIICIDYGMGLK